MISQSVHLDCERPGTVIRIETDRRCRPICHVCGKAGAIHSGGLHRVVRDLDLGPAQTFLEVEYRRAWCDSCRKARVEQLSFCGPGKRITHRLAQYLYDLCKVLTVQEVSRRFDLDPKTVKAVEKSFLEREFGANDYSGLSILAIDEIAVHDGQNGYMTVALDYLSGRVVWMGEGRSAETLDAFFQSMTDAQRGAIEAVTMDMWEPFINRVRHHCPNARIVFDLFHLVKAYGEVIDEVRRDEQRKADASMGKILKGSRYLLLSNAANLGADQSRRLRGLLDLNERLNSVYILKDQLKLLYRYRYPRWAKKALDAWCVLAQDIDHPFMQRFIGRLRYFEYGILNHCFFPIGTSKLEGVNNKIKLIKRKAYGFHDSRYFALKVKQAFPGKSSPTKTG
jgi:transposase